MTLDFDTCYRAILARDARFDGRFYTGVTTTGIYCRPICPARTPARRNVRFFPHAGAAEAAGFRACRRCRPEASPGSPEWNTRADLAARAVRLICDGYVDEHGVRGLASALAVTERHLRRLLLTELGAGPLALARAARLQTARRLLTETRVPVTEVAFASGFASVRQFDATFQQAYGHPPSSLRTGRFPPVTAACGPAPGDVAPISLRLRARGRYDGTRLLRFLAARAIPGVEEISGDAYRRTIHAPGGPGLIELTLPPGGPPDRPGPAEVTLRIHLPGIRGAGQVVSRCRRLLDLDTDPDAVEAVLAADHLLAPLVAARPGLRVPGAYDGFELAVRAVLGQQISVAGARTLAGRLAARYGIPVPGATPAAAPPAAPAATAAVASTAPGAASHRATMVAFPGPADLADADLSGIGLTTARQATLRALAAAVATGRLRPGPGADPEETAARLREIPGIGPWTVAYILMRAVHDPDAFPATDLGLRRALGRLGVDAGHAARWRPWRAYAALHLWAALAESAAPAPGSRPVDSRARPVASRAIRNPAGHASRSGAGTVSAPDQERS